MTRSLAIDENRDLYLSGPNALAQVTGLGAVLQNCETAARTLLNEMVLAQGEGLPYFEAVWIGQPDLPTFEAALLQRLSDVEGVTGIVELATVVEANTFKYSATISTIYGEGSING